MAGRERLLLVAALVQGWLLSCGGAGEPPFAGVRLPDVAPWRDLGPVALCDGAVRLGRPGSRAAGFCVEQLPSVACVVDGDCRSRERCVCGTCEVAWCDAADECTAGDVCNFAEHRCDRPCHGDGECATGERCEPGLSLCRAPCASTANCQAGEVCEAGLCVVSLGRGGACARDTDCLDHPLCARQRRPADLREPSILVESGRLVLYVEVVESGAAPGGEVASIWRAPEITGAPEARWFRLSPEAPVIAPGPSHQRRAGAPSVARDADGSVVLAFADGAGRLHLARSPDGVTFTIVDAPLLRPEDDWRGSGLDSPSLLAPADSPTGSWLLYFTDRAGSAIGVAAGGDGRTFSTVVAGRPTSPDPPDPILSPADLTAPSRWRAVDRLGGPEAWSIRSPSGALSVRLLLHAHGRESDDALQFGVPVAEVPNDSIGAAASSDGRAFVPWPYNPVFDRTIQYLDHPSEQQPAVAPLGDHALLFYRVASADGSRGDNLRVATTAAP